MNITEICADVRNYFLTNREKDIHKGHFIISGSTIEPLVFLKKGQFFRVVGSTLNDGVYCNTIDGMYYLKDEEFTGAIWAMSVPPSFIQLCEEIEEWRAKNESLDSQNMSPFTSESFGGYSYSKGSGNSSSSGNSITWQNQFAGRLNSYRRISVL